jgi:alkanesulfonate monooxygenase SsuD/methylene tetrahydromethanopterin reductase-like flavin-dependent oxidoreductase (luciferase family)
MLYGVGPRPNKSRHPYAVPDAALNCEYFKHHGKIAEEGKVDFIFMADSLAVSDKTVALYLSRFEPLAMLAAVVEATSHISRP